ncbi:hypothetical protein A3C87_01245 [Candidatus Kaiserbacteria bacterium RIFCSPHIGHO2_02_FULL_49_34]|uniref:VWFA domain-containing protein n=1 Tax=Candidatus Kaiserbacteria bacterium RIFCSPHIGHO2_02_FULL_49_34 TaxID=1798491 RepID=A0A1F6DLA1_9BACT|nr:MAG: hypothetical protein A3C87_01245 [Candidatus Kaiserbacteria bacterium RIFCSPHIGHO2_02_FULL_49_34]
MQETSPHNTTEFYTPSPLRWWAFSRQVLYGTGILVLVLALMYWGYRSFLYAEPTCFDGIENGMETGIDCGGACDKICTATVVAPKVEWAQAFKVTDGVYHAVAVVTNANRVAGTRSLPYTIILEDAQGVIAERSGTTTLPPDGQYPLFEARIATGVRTPTSVRITFDHATSYWSALTWNRNDYTVLTRTISGAGAPTPRLTASIQNNLYTATEDLRVVAVVYDSKRMPLVASQTVIPRLGAQEKRDAIFTWTSPIAGTLRSCQIPSDLVLMMDRSGSMAADGGTPPEPLHSAKNAAASFIETLGASDRAGLVSYATTPSIDGALAVEHAQTRDAIMNITIGKDGIQYTDLSAAIREAARVLQAGHNPDARQVIALLTDGDVTRPLNPQGVRDIPYAEAQALEAADAVKRAGISLYTIGFGKVYEGAGAEVARNRELITALATSPAHSFFAPTATDLAGVYKEISEGICEDGPAIIDIFIVPQ